jgi:WhiB family redox-sensing transcriptional regulator
MNAARPRPGDRTGPASTTGQPTPGRRLKLPGTRRTISRDDAIQVWDDALCAQVDPELFFPDKGDSAAPARRVCGLCEVTALCLATFGPVVDHGVVGGQTPQQRAATRRQARQSEAA